jgi:hypothetical protein
VQVATVPASHFNMGGRAFTTSVALPRDPQGSAAEHLRIAIASVDGTMRILNGFNPDSVIAGFATRKDAAICVMAVIPLQSRDAVIAGAPFGAFYSVWKLLGLP